MSLVKQFYIQCDFCFNLSTDVSSHHIKSAKELRAHLHGSGWEKRGHKDICWDCVRLNPNTKKNG